MISIIAAIAKNGTIGKENKLPWDIKKDMKRFKEKTLGKPVVMGRKTYESIGKALPKRENIVLTRQKDFNPSGVKTFNSIKKVLEFVKGYPEAMIIGGASIYKQFLPYTDKMYLTIIDKEFEGDTSFPSYNKKDWEEIERKEFNNKSPNFTFITLKRK